ncbi:Uncharacterised protein [Vibrio cholerae]|nr:Uncharacterised protein [Vibrio cholerae]
MNFGLKDTFLACFERAQPHHLPCRYDSCCFQFRMDNQPKYDGE